MPIITGLPMPDLTPPPIPSEGKDFPIPGDPRFTGYKLVRDSYGNILVPVQYVNQPYFWSVRGVRIANWDLRSP